MKLKAAALSVLLGASLLFSGCLKSPEATKQDGKLTVYTTIFPLADFTKKIGGDYVDVQSIYPAGADAHTFEPSQKQMVQIAKANVFVYNGAELEPFVDKVEQSLKKEKVSIVNASKGLALLKASDDEDATAGHEHDEDPHVWLDPLLAMKQAEAIKNALVKLEPSHKTEFEKNYEALAQQFTQLDQQFKDLVQHAKTKEVLVSHAAYGYWEHRYGIKQIAVTGVSSAQEPSQKQLAAIADTAKAHGIKYILFETFSTPRVAEVVQKETNTKALYLHHISTISDQDLKAKKDYFTLMEENLKALQTAMNS
ncbi:metal ABC transporter substrate-binding protein [Ectobacillus ponti]|uniref:Metal ABC transporter substrate-binding protein n=1 Tax=Ectobacillus ponti TaxID=2961894 RepID=A0AA41X8Y8_9BACI|nr:metal ABC transporter substrate-binding protein [Ectobacillus ponti]MCP8968884.1 metal ABC transporter substrate-binding protein [Ectobacillus ponti]